MIKGKIKASVMLVASAVLIAGFVFRGASATVPGVNEAVDVNSTGGVPSDGSYPPGDGSYAPSISQNGRYIAFGSAATNLVTSPTASGSYGEVYVRDRFNNTTTMVSVNSSGDPANANASQPEISANGRYIVYQSSASNLTSDFNRGGYNHIYEYDTQTGTTQIVDKDSSGTFTDTNREASMPSVSADGNYVVFEYESFSSSNLVSSPSLSAYTQYVFEKNMSTGAVTLVSIGTGGSAPNAASSDAYIDCDGGYVAYDSTATNLVSGGGSGHSDVYLYSALNGAVTDLTSSANDSSSANGISCDGEYVGVSSNATNLTATSLTSGHSNAFEYDRVGNDFSLLSQSTGGTQANGDCSSTTISDDGKYATFDCYNASNLVSTSTSGANVYLRNVEAGTTELVSEDSSGNDANGDSKYPVLSADGRYVSYISLAQNLVSGYYYYGSGHYWDLIFVSQTGAADDY